MPTNLVKIESDEKKWRKAKALARKEGQSNNYAYITSIYQNLKGEKKAEILSKLIKLAQAHSARMEMRRSYGNIYGQAHRGQAASPIGGAVKPNFTPQKTVKKIPLKSSKTKKMLKVFKALR